MSAMSALKCKSSDELLDKFFFYLSVAIQAITLRFDGLFLQVRSRPEKGKSSGKRGRKGRGGSQSPPSEQPVDQQGAKEALQGSAAAGGPQHAKQGAGAAPEPPEVPEGGEPEVAEVTESSRPCAPSKRGRHVPTFVESICLTEASPNSFATQVRCISLEAFDEDATKPQMKGERVAVAVLDGDVVVGYASYTLRPQCGSLNVQKLAVANTHRRQGLGRCLINNLKQLAKRPLAQPAQRKGGGSNRGPQAEVVCLSSVPSAVRFYKACGFREEHVQFKEEDADDLVEGQVYMEYSLRRRRGK